MPTGRLEEGAEIFSGGIMVVNWNREDSNWTQGQKIKNSLKIIKHLIRLPREVMESLSWQVFKTQLDKALNNVV